MSRGDPLGDLFGLNPLVRVTGLEVFADASGATATLSYKGLVYACNWLGNARVERISRGNVSRREGLIAASVVTKAFTQVVHANTSAQWRADCAAMYAS